MLADAKDALKGTLVELADSKKFMVAAAGFLAVVILKIAGKYGYAVDQETASWIADRLVALAGSYVLGQAIADHGKGAAEVQASAPSTPSVPPVVKP